MARMVDSNADWHVERKIPVDHPQQVGLSVGHSAELVRQINASLPALPSFSAGTIPIGVDVSATLIGDGSEVDIAPDQAVDESTGSDIALLWTWQIHPKVATDDLHLAAQLVMKVPGTDHVLTRDVPLDLVVYDTVSHRANQVFTNYVTWAAITGAVLMALQKLLAWLRSSGERPGAGPKKATKTRRPRRRKSRS